ncbi:MAG TPA: cytochrome c oxidase assembly protein [Candidatus Eisenbacteria bacterium]|nr:cytochrome c oxidase assembly protein [Candidatus Eisenbacteria bacterium]
MSPSFQGALESWSFPVVLTLAMILSGFLYLRGWLHLRSVSASVIPFWRAVSFLLGLLFVWAAVGSPFATFDEELLTVHMIQHLLLMTLAPPLILLGAPLMPLLHGLPRQFVQSGIGSVFRWPAMRRVWRALSHPAVCWLAAAGALVGWHIPSVFWLAMQSESWHIVEHACFFGSGLLFWWPVVQPWPSVPTWPRWSILIYLFLATLPCDILSAFLVFCDRVVYRGYLFTPRQFGISALEDQQCAGALMWTCVTIFYLLAAAIIVMRLLSVRSIERNELMQLDLPATAAPHTSQRSAEVA